MYEMPVSVMSVLCSQLPAIEKLFRLLEEGKCSLKLQWEITWSMINIMCLPTEVVAYFIKEYKALRVLALTISRCNDKQELINTQLEKHE
jgi:hypothetical protein